MSQRELMEFLAKKEGLRQRWGMGEVLSSDERDFLLEAKPPDLKVKVKEGDRPLGPQQQQVLQLLDRGMGSKEIGKILGISARTVDHHVERIFKNLGVSTRAQAVEVARGRGLLPIG